MTTILVLSTVSIITIYKAEGSSGTTLYAGGSGPGNYTSIQLAIDGASNGDTVLVYNGTYQENVDVNKSLSIQSKYGSVNCIVESADMSDHVFEITVDYVNISGFTVKGISSISSPYPKAGVCLYYVDFINISGNTILNNSCGVYLNSSSTNTITANIIKDNFDDRINLFNSESNTLTGNTIINNYDSIDLDSSSNNIVMVNTITNSYGGIGLDSSSNNIVMGNTVTNASGIYLDSSSNNTLMGNTLTNNEGAIDLFSHCNNNTLKDNIITGNTNDGIHIYDSTSNSITGNTIINNSDDGIHISSGGNNTITGNTLINNTNLGIILHDSGNNTLTDNTFFNCGLYALSLFLNTITNNTVNGRPLIYLQDKSDIIIDNANEAGQIILVNCINITVQNQELSNNNIGIELWDTNNCFIVGNTIINNTDNGILLSSGSDNNIITGNTIIQNNYGINLDHSDKNTMIGNTIIQNNHGIDVDHSNRNTIIGNTITQNNFGIYLTYSGGYSDGYAGNKIYHNNFINNPTHAIIYYGIKLNTWDNGYPGGGNYWSNFDEPDEGAFDNNSDGIADTSRFIHSIRWTTEGNDHEYRGINLDGYPLVIPYRSPVAYFTYSIDGPIVHFTDVSYDPDGYLVKYKWNFDDNNYSNRLRPIHKYERKGTYTVTLTVTDNDIQTDSFTQVITVKEDDRSGIPPSVEFILIILSIIGLIFAAIAVWKFL